jgi:hypothetical protein
LNARVNGSWTEWSGNTIVELTNGSVRKQVEYYYEYRYSHHPEVIVAGDRMQVEGMNRAVRVRRLA